MTDNEKITALRDALIAVLSSETGRSTLAKLDRGQGTDTDDGRVWLAALAMTADASEPAPDSAPKFDEAEFDAMVERGTKVWSKVPDDWLENHRAGADRAADARAKEAYDYRHLTQVAQGMGFEDIAGALTELVRLRGDEPVIDSESTFKTVTESFNRGWNAGYRAAQQGAADGEGI